MQGGQWADRVPVSELTKNLEEQPPVGSQLQVTRPELSVLPQAKARLQNQCPWSKQIILMTPQAESSLRMPCLPKGSVGGVSW